ncbi:MAG: S8 family peptidase [Reichenbachiella sp.]|uniref:S8 family peptidase n=1 Tax=Reichenbachiella sp. TaxID=2184521 RepID=UPI002966B596|nr:S8 family peptidase [Reichenbachiella sp.]MDW3210597.1 S8 family peptidase [Reichenbachiella sp.]
MGKNKVFLIYLVLCVSTQMAVAQSDRYVVYFTDKANSSYSIDNPAAYLSAKAIERREDQSIAISSEDLPVNSSYINAVKNTGAETYFTSRWMNAVLVEATTEEIEAIEALDQVLKTEYAAPGQKLNGTPDPVNNIRLDEEPSNVANINSDKQISMLGANLMHDDGMTGKDVWIAVFDDGFLDANKSSVFAHTFENQKLNDVFDFTTGGQDVFQYDDHGTGTWSCLGASWSSTFVGTGYDANISLYITEDVSSEYRIEEYNWLFAAERADSAGVDIITSSLGYSDFDDASMDYTVEDLDGNTSVISKAAAMAIERGILVVTSAGNSGNSSTWPYISMPADVENIISVGALDEEYNLVSFSSVGPTADNRIKPEVVAMGYQTTVLGGGNTMVKKNGTSFAAPLIAGFAAGLWQKFPTLTNLELRDLILTASDNFASPDNKVGYGLPNYNSAIGEEPLAVTKYSEDALTVYPNPATGDHINIRIEKGSVPMPLKLKLYSQSGKLLNEKTIKRTRKGQITELNFNQSGQGIYFLQIESESYFKNVKILRY